VPRERGGVVGVYSIHRYTTNSPNISFIEIYSIHRYSTQEKLGEGEYTILIYGKRKEGGGDKKKLGKFI
jgi:hypothetical protein